MRINAPKHTYDSHATLLQLVSNSTDMSHRKLQQALDRSDATVVSSKAAA